MTDTISIKLLRTLSRGVSALGSEARNRIAEFVISQQAGNGGFCNKSGVEDIYYTSFGWLLALVLDVELDKKSMASYLQQIDPTKLDLVHYAAYMRCRMLSQYANNKIGFTLNALRRVPLPEMESYASVPNNDISSPYSQFILYSLCEDTNNPAEVLPLDDYKTPQGYTNTRAGVEASTNATAAALMVKGQALGYDSSCEEIELLRNMQLECGGFKADGNTLMPDLLSTATALFTLHSYGVAPRQSASEFVEAHWLDSGGFAATVLDAESDVEYTFYGLLALGTL